MVVAETLHKPDGPLQPSDLLHSAAPPCYSWLDRIHLTIRDLLILPKLSHMQEHPVLTSRVDPSELPDQAKAFLQGEAVVDHSNR